MKHSDITKLKADTNAVELAKKVLVAQAWEATMRDVVVAKAEAVISQYNFQVAPEWMEKGADSSVKYGTMYLASEQDFDTYINAMFAFYTEKGFDVKRGECPYLIAGHDTIKASREFGEAIEKYTGINYDEVLCLGVEQLKEYVNLGISMAIGK